MAYSAISADMPSIVYLDDPKALDPQLGMGLSITAVLEARALPLDRRPAARIWPRGWDGRLFRATSRATKRYWQSCTALSMPGTRGPD